MNKPNKQGYFITFEGGDAVGKSTQIKILQELNISNIYCTNPSELASAKSIRSLLLEQDQHFEINTEILIHLAARIEHVAKIIKPKLLSGINIVCDRFIDSTIVYQAYAHNLSPALIIKLHQLLIDNLKPDLTFIFDLNPAQAMARLEKRAGKIDRYEAVSQKFNQKIREGFLQIAQNNQDRCVIIDALQNIEEIAAIIQNTIKQRLGLCLDK